MATLCVVSALMLFRFLRVHRRDTCAAFGRKMSYVAHNLPHLRIFKKTAPTRHTAHPNPVLNDPVQLPVSVFLNILHCKVRHRGRHLFRKGYARILAVESMADLAMMLKMFSTGVYCGLVVRNRIRLVLPADHEFLRFLGDFRFNLAWRRRLTRD